MLNVSNVGFYTNSWVNLAKVLSYLSENVIILHIEKKKFQKM